MKLLRVARTAGLTIIGRIFQGHINTPLNDTGRAQAQTVAKRLLDDEGVRFDMAFSSDSDRASDVSLSGYSMS
jgi:broad specificity phosphatase PhoE